jgi:hypothetical protein
MRNMNSVKVRRDQVMAYIEGQKEKEKRK